MNIYLVTQTPHATEGTEHTIAELEKDKARLDWLGENLSYIMLAPKTKTAMELLKNNGRGWSDGELRAAIDSARNNQGCKQ